MVDFFPSQFFNGNIIHPAGCYEPKLVFWCGQEFSDFFHPLDGFVDFIDGLAKAGVAEL